jgi:hypothetical protein
MIAFGAFETGYGLQNGNLPAKQTSTVSFGQTRFGFEGAADYINGQVELQNPGSGLEIDTDGWTRVFTVCFDVDDPEALAGGDFCPPVVWDMEEIPANGGFLPASNGVVVTLLDAWPNSKPTTEQVEQFNWEYDGTPETVPWGYPDPTDCIDIGCIELGDAPEQALAYPSLGVMGMFPTCLTDDVNGNYIRHVGNSVYFGPSVDYEVDGNANLCTPGYTIPYDNDESFVDGDAGLIKPKPYTINNLNQIVPLAAAGEALGEACMMSYWGKDVDILVKGEGYVNVLVDWDQNGQWGGFVACPSGNAYEHVLINFPVNAPVPTPLSTLMPPNTGFQAGIKGGFVWTRFTITRYPIEIQDWDGSGDFTAGETEDYLVYVKPTREVPVSNWSVIITVLLIASALWYTIRFRMR